MNETQTIPLRAPFHPPRARFDYHKVKEAIEHGQKALQHLGADRPEVSEMVDAVKEIDDAAS